ncbi:MAG TPA: alpha/beta hydrolase [Actinopolymorphaceae bacterium]
MTTKKARKWPRRVLWISAGLVVAVALAGTWYVVRNLNYDRWDRAKVDEAGFVERQVEINGTRLNYAEGPDNGPALLLVHGQVTDWGAYNRVLPELSQDFHVFAVDCHGHGKSERAPEKYNAKAMAADFRQFLRQVVKEPAVVSGHSSGGLVAAVMAAEAPDQVRGVILEDPPFFSSVHPRAEKTFNQVALATTAHEFLRSGEKDFTSYHIRHDAIWDLFQGLKNRVQQDALSYRRDHPGEPTKIFYMPPELNEMFRAMDSYDPRFGEAFYDNSFHDGFDHAETLARIEVPAVLIHTNWRYDENGVLQAAMDGKDAERARSLLRDVEFHKVDTGHSFQFEDPGHYIRIARDFAARLDH